MKKRPLPVMVISLILIATGALGIAFHLNDFSSGNPFQFDVIGVAAVRLLAVLAGVFLLRAAGWARWLALGWIGFHVVISFLLNSVVQVAVHILVFALFVYFLYRPKANEYFRGGAA
jgi:hypothetical protein